MLFFFFYIPNFFVFFFKTILEILFRMFFVGKIFYIFFKKEVIPTKKSTLYDNMKVNQHLYSSTHFLFFFTKIRWFSDPLNNISVDFHF